MVLLTVLSPSAFNYTHGSIGMDIHSTIIPDCDYNCHPWEVVMMHCLSIQGASCLI